MALSSQACAIDAARSFDDGGAMTARADLPADRGDHFVDDEAVPGDWPASRWESA
jgi:hypothetical protein